MSSDDSRQRRRLENRVKREARSVVNEARRALRRHGDRVPDGIKREVTRLTDSLDEANPGRRRIGHARAAGRARRDGRRAPGVRAQVDGARVHRVDRHRGHDRALPARLRGGGVQDPERVDDPNHGDRRPHLRQQVHLRPAHPVHDHPLLRAARAAARRGDRLHQPVPAGQGLHQAHRRHPGGHGRGPLRHHLRERRGGAGPPDRRRALRLLGQGRQVAHLGSQGLLELRRDARRDRAHHHPLAGAPVGGRGAARQPEGALRGRGGRARLPGRRRPGLRRAAGPAHPRSSASARAAGWRSRSRAAPATTARARRSATTWCRTGMCS